MNHPEDADVPQSLSTANRDIVYASMTLLFGITVGCVLLYGSWYRKSQLAADYKTELGRAQQRYQQAFADADTPAIELFQLGSEIDLRMRRIGRQPNAPDTASPWQRLEFSQRHADRLDRLIQRSNQGVDAQGVEDVRLKIKKYRESTQTLARSIQASTSPRRHDAALRLIESPIVSGQLNLAQLDERQQDLAKIIQQSAADSATNHSPSDDAGTYSKDQTVRRAATLMAWLWIEKTWQSASITSPLAPTQQAIDTGLDELAKLQRTISELTLDDASERETRAAIALSRLLIQLNSASSPNDQARRDIQQGYQQAEIQGFSSARRDSIADFLPNLLSNCLTSNWIEIRETLASVDQPTSPLGPQETAVLRRLVSRTICRLAAARQADVLPDGAGAALSGGLDLAVDFDSGSSEVSSLIWDLSLLTSQRGLAWVDADTMNRLESAKESTLANPSQPAFLVTSAIAAGIDGNDSGLEESHQTGRMLQAQLPIRLAFVAIWRFQATGLGHMNGDSLLASDPESLTAQEASIWCRILEHSVPTAEAETGLDPASPLGGYPELSLAAWQACAGDIESSRANLHLAKEAFGPSPNVLQIVQQIESVLAAAAKKKDESPTAP
ncbi:hypothetical protein K227x_18710 [Rubripirellula lacrimiformis]|uniref:Uncharacterized protein n=1 Tax=Rubripirellula lacrimiformis TaxID=1930273 RepID=A0A517N8L5_9BACT|nr:hypothetical protein [Rubripirellula lacrimiformis]QDT03487.1 hypothetical protein K227x_18710 [Rubripirellula lacrimiformis]